MEKGIFKTIFLVVLLACGSQAVWGMKGSKGGMFSKKSYNHSIEVEIRNKVVVNLTPPEECFTNKLELKAFIVAANAAVAVEEEKWGGKRDVVVKFFFSDDADTLFSEECMIEIVKGVSNVGSITLINNLVNEHVNRANLTTEVSRSKNGLTLFKLDLGFWAQWKVNDYKVINTLIQNNIMMFRDALSLGGNEYKVYFERDFPLVNSKLVACLKALIYGVKNVVRIGVTHASIKDLKALRKFLPNSLEELYFDYCDVYDGYFYSTFYKMQKKLKKLRLLELFSPRGLITPALSEKLGSNVLLKIYS